jgi:hypothetical protein
VRADQRDQRVYYLLSNFLTWDCAYLYASYAFALCQSFSIGGYFRTYQAYTMQSYTPRVLYVLVFGPGRSTLLCMLPSPQTDVIFSAHQIRLRTNKLVPTSS